MLHQVTQFVMKHWALIGAFIIVAILLVIEEMRVMRGRGQRISVAMAVQLINREEATVIDLREASAFREGHIVNARNIPLVDFDHQQEKLNSLRDRYIILVDAMGLKTSPIAKRLKDAGFTKVVSLKAGVDGWKAASMPIVKK